MAPISKERQRKWIDAVSSMEMSRNSRKTWNLIRKLNNDPASPKQQHYPVTANQVANQLLINEQRKGKEPPIVKFKNTDGENNNLNLTSPFTSQELNDAITTLKTGKAIGLDGIFTEELKHFGLVARKWLLKLFNWLLRNQKNSQDLAEITSHCYTQTRQRSVNAKEL